MNTINQGASSGELLQLAERIEAATGPGYALDAAIWCALNGVPLSEKIVADFEVGRQAPRYTASIDAAMTLLPATAANIDVFSFTRNGVAWGCRFHDTAQMMGKRAAKEQIARLRKEASFGASFRGGPALVLEQAIAEHWIEFFCLGAATPALALCAAALKARAAQGGDR